MTRRPAISDARYLRAQTGARAVIVLALDRVHVAAASYGDTKRECGAPGVIVDRIVAEFEAGRFGWPTEAR